MNLDLKCRICLTRKNDERTGPEPSINQPVPKTGSEQTTVTNQNEGKCTSSGSSVSGLDQRFVMCSELALEKWRLNPEWSKFQS
jgi:hypothetical protein